MAGISHQNTCVEEREKLAFSKEKADEVCQSLIKEENVEGCILLATCNRTELYLSCNDEFNKDAGKLLLEKAKINDFNSRFEILYNTDVVYYLMELACGLKSRIIGESQIVNQINSALEESRELGCTDSIIDTLFRIAVSAGKYSLTNAKLTNVPVSASYAGVEILERKFGSLKDKNCVVIGNGKMGAIAQRLLIEKGARVYVTLRNYKHGNNEIVTGCEAISYNERYAFIDGCDYVISATRSPHFTMTYDNFKALKNKPKAVVDLSMPRDIEDSIGELTNCYNIDDLGIESKIDENELNTVYDIIEKFAGDFFSWKNYKMSLPAIGEIKEIISQRIIKSSDVSDEFKDNTIDEIVEKTVDRAVDILLGSMKNNVMPEIMEICKKKIEERARL